MTESNFSCKLLRGSVRRFFPEKNLESKRNFCRHVFIEQDGKITEIVRLNVLNDRHREDVIGYHFSLQYGEMHYGEQSEPPQFYVVGRDCPWDFEYVLHDTTTFFLEITRVADKALLKAMKAENEVNTLLNKGELKGYEILKIEKKFPGTLPNEIVRKIQTKADKKASFPIDPEHHSKRVFIRPTMFPRINLESAIRTAIQKKIDKPHVGKERTILLLDNLTTHSDPDDFFDAVEALSDFLDSIPFLSIWLYTGYYSDDDGLNCEFSLFPIKPSKSEAEFLNRDESWFSRCFSKKNRIKFQFWLPN